MTTPKNLKEQLEALGAKEGDEFVDDNGNEWSFDGTHISWRGLCSPPLWVVDTLVVPGLRHKPKMRKVEFWVNVYLSHGEHDFDIHYTKSEADRYGKDRAACQKFEMEVPEK